MEVVVVVMMVRRVGGGELMPGQQINEKLIKLFFRSSSQTFFLPLISLLPSLYVQYLFLFVHHLVIFLLG
jgi:hypothetical protein